MQNNVLAYKLLSFKERSFILRFCNRYLVSEKHLAMKGVG